MLAALKYIYFFHFPKKKSICDNCPWNDLRRSSYDPRRSSYNQDAWLRAEPKSLKREK